MNKNMNYIALKIYSFAYLDLERRLSIFLCSLGSLDLGFFHCSSLSYRQNNELLYN